MHNLNLNLLRALAVLLETRNVSQSAERLHLTQSAMSRQLSQLRDYFDDPLLIREGNDYLLSARARLLSPRVQQILVAIGGLKDDEGFDPQACQRRFRFACTDYVAQLIFPEVLNMLQQKAPHVDIVYQLWQPQWLNQMAQLPLDFASTMTRSVPENIRSICMGQDRSVCLMRSQHPLVSEKAPGLKALLKYSFVHLNSGGDKDSFFDKVLADRKLKRRILFEVPFFSAAFQVVSQSDTLLIVPEHIARNAGRYYDLSYCPLPIESPENHYHFCWHDIHDADPAHQWIRECIAAVISESIYSPRGMQ